MQSKCLNLLLFLITTLVDVNANTACSLLFRSFAVVAVVGFSFFAAVSATLPSTVEFVLCPGGFLFPRIPPWSVPYHIIIPLAPYFRKS